MGRELMVLGSAFLLCGLLARAGARIGLPTIPLFVLAGIAVGPHTGGVVLFDHPEELELLAAFGLVFLLFYLGVEFSIDDIASGGRKLLASAGAYLALNMVGGLVLGLSFGWGTREAFVIAGATGISSSAIVTKVLIELRRLGNPETRLILGIIVIEDLFLALYLAALAPVLGDAKTVAGAALLFGRALAFLVALSLLARFGGRWVAKALSAKGDELLVVLFVGWALLVAGIAAELGVSDAIGAFMAGLVLADSTIAGRIERLVRPLRDAFASLFFFAFGLVIDPTEVADVALPAIAAIGTTVLLATLAALAAARINGLGRVATANIASSLAARGEFSLILATLAVAAGLDERIAPFVAIYVLALAVISPLAAARSDLLAKALPRRVLDRSPEVAMTT